MTRYLTCADCGVALTGPGNRRLRCPACTRALTAGFRVGDPVRTLPTVRPKQWADRAGFVASLNSRDGEIGVCFAAVARREAEAWFTASELALVKGGETPPDAPGATQAPSADETTPETVQGATA